MDYSKFERFDDRELMAMGFLAFYCGPISKGNLLYYLQRISYRLRTQAEKFLQSPNSEDVITRIPAKRCWEEDSYTIADKWNVRTLCWVLSNQPEWLAKFRTVIGKRECIHLFREKLISFIDCYLKGETFTEHFDDGYSYLVSIFTPLIGDEEAEPILKALPTDVVAQLAEVRISECINNDSSESLEPLIDWVTPQDDDSREWEEMLAHLQLGYYLQTGQCSNRLRPIPESRYTDLMLAIKAMAEGDYAKANKLFLFNKQLEKINIWPEHSIVSFLMVVSYIQEHKGIDKKNPFANLANNGGSAQAARIVIEKIATIEPTQCIKEIIRLMESAASEGSINMKLAHMICKWEKLTATELKQNSREIDYRPNSISYDTFATQLAEQTLKSLSVKADWEKAIDSILASEEKINHPETTSVDEASRTSRIAYYYYEGYRNPEIREQSRLKNGKWGCGKRVSDYKFIYYDDDMLDSTDRLVKGLYQRHRYDDVTFSELLPILDGTTDKLFMGEGSPYISCHVKEDKPFLSAKIGTEYISVSSNIPAHQLNSNDEDELMFALTETTPKLTKEVRATQVQRTGELSYFRVPVRLRSYLRMLIQIGQFPLEAEPQLRKLFEQIKGLIEIHSELVEGGSNLPQVDGDSHIVIQALPIGSDYQVQAIVRPLPDGRQLVLPGRGDNNIFDQAADGTRLQIVRNKKLEKQHVQPLVDFMEQAEIDPVSNFVWRVDPYVLLDLLEWIPEQGDDFILEWPEGQQIRLSTTNTQNWHIALKEKAGWFDVEGEVPIDDQTVLSIGQLLELLQDGGGRFIRLQDGQYIRLTDSLRRQLRRLDSVAQTSRGKTRISKLGAGLIADYLEGDINIEHPKSIDNLRKNILDSQNLQAQVPDELNATLRDYQEEGFRWIDRLASWGAGACLADDMGLGKTIQTITYLLYKKAEGASLVVAPASVVANWKKEIARFAPTLNVAVLNDLASDDRKSAIQQAQAGDVVLSTYGLLISEEEPVTEKQWNIVCLDEAHSIKNASTKSSAVCMKLQASRRLILTGTPIQNHLGELWNLFQFINPGLLGSYEQFTQKYIAPIEVAHNKERQQQLKRIVQPFMLRRTKQEVIAELPDKQEITLPVQLSNAEMAIYELIRKEAKSQLEEDASGNGAASVNALAMITKLRMASCAASLAQKKWSGQSSKLEAFSDLVSEICSAGNHILVFSQFTSFLEMAREQLKAQGISDYLYLDGSTPLAKRNKMVEAFQAGKAAVFLISLKAGGLGLNLTNANYVIHLDPWWNPAIEQQATDRAYRIGQQQKVTVYHLISEHTIEEKIVRLHQTKRDLADSLLEGTDMSHKLNASDLLAMLDEAK